VKEDGKLRVYGTDDLRNVAVVAHGGAGKTSLVEAMLFNSQAIKRLGRVDEGNTVTDYFPEEISRKITINTTPAPCEWQGIKVNLLDTPGYSDFFGDVQSALRVSDGLLMVVCAVSGVEVQTEVIWDYAGAKELPRVIFINKMDRENADFTKVLEQLRQDFGNKVVPLVVPMGSAESFAGVVDILTGKAYTYQDGKAVEGPVPGELADEIEAYRQELLETVAETDDELLMRYLDGEELEISLILQALKTATKAGQVFPVLCGSALKNMGTDLLLNSLINLMPSPAEAQGASAEELQKLPVKALVFKTIADPYVGKLSFFRIYSGVLKSDISILSNVNHQEEEKINQFFVFRGKNQEQVQELHPGDIGAFTKLQVTGTGDTLSLKGVSETLPGIEFIKPTLTMAVFPKSKGDEDKLGNALQRLIEEDPTLKVEKNTETKETLLTGTGEMHLDITVERLKRKFGVEVEVSTPTVPYRETIKKKVSHIEGKHKKQSGGHGQYGHIFIDLEPVPDTDFEFQETIFGGAVPKQYIPAVEKGMREALQSGILAGFPVTNVKITLTDGSYHPVDSSEMAFKIAASLAFKKGVEQGNPVLLEPIMNVEIRVPEQFMGDIIGDLNSKRGRVLGMEPDGKFQVIRALVPLAEMYRYAIDLKSITQGRGTFTMTFSNYEEVPAQLTDKIVAEVRAKAGAE